MRLSLRCSALAVVVLVVPGLAGGATVEPYDYTAFRQSPPRSILILPPINESDNVDGTYGYLSTVSQLVAERGYYVFPVLVAAQLLKENDIPVASELDQAALDKLREITGADAVLFATVHEFGKWIVDDYYSDERSIIIVRVSARLVDTRTGTLLWEGSGKAHEDSGSVSNIAVDALVTGAINSIVNSKMEPSPGAGRWPNQEDSRLANMHMFTRATRELPFGPYHTESAKPPLTADTPPP